MAARLPPAVTARFKVHGTFASGSTGTCHRATDSTTGKEGLLKIVQSAAQLTPSERGRLVRELEKLVTLRHPSLAAIHAAGIAEDLPWLFRDLVEGESLEARLSRGPVPVPEALGIAAQIASGLDELHRAGLLQRDLSPSHVILSELPGGAIQAVLIDSGIAGRVPTSTLFEISGKPAYVSPEHAQGKLVSFRSDLYSLGAVLYQMVTGAPIHQGTADEVLEAQRSSPAPAIPPGLVPTNIATLLGQLLAKEPRERPFSAQQVRRALEPFLPAGLPAAPPAGSAAKKTLLGVPSPVGAKRADQTEELSALDVVRAEAVLRGQPPPPPAAPPPRADATMPLTPLDLARAEAVLRGQPPPKSMPPPPPPAAMAPSHGSPERTMPPRTDMTAPLFAKDLAPMPNGAPAAPKSMPPPPPPAAMKPPTAPPPARPPSQRPPPAPVSTTLIGMSIPKAPPAPVVAPPVAAPPVEAAVAVAPIASAPIASAPAAGPSPADLDYDDLAETKARDVEGVSAYAPTVEQPAPMAAASPPFGGAPSQPFGSAPSQPFGGAPSQPFGGAPSQPFGSAPIAATSTPVGGAPSTGAPNPFGAPSAVTTTSPGLGGAPAAMPVASAPPPAMAHEVPVRKTPVAVWIALGLVGFCLVASLSGGAVAWYVTSSAVATIMPPTPATPMMPAPMPTPVAPPTMPAAPMPALPMPSPMPAPMPGPAAPMPPVVAPVAPAPVVPEVAPAPPPVVAPPPPVVAPPVAEAERETETEPGSGGRRSGRSGRTGGASSSSAAASGGSSGGGAAAPSGGTGRLASRIGGGGASGGSSGGASGGSSGGASSGGGGGASPAAAFEAARSRALEAFRARRFPDAEREYLAATRLNPRHAGVWAGLGAARMAQRNARGAVDAYQHAVTLQPTSAGFHASLGRALAESGDRAGARREYDAALRIDPDNRDARTGLERL